MSSDAPPRPSALVACENCGTKLAGPYCYACGQHAIDYRRSFHHLVHDTLENLFHFDGKFLVSVAWLLAKPGRITVEFNARRRQSQVPPLRFYIFVTVLFFLGVHLLNHGHLLPYDEREIDRTSITAPAGPGTVERGRGAHTTVTLDQNSPLGRALAAKIRTGDLTLSSLLAALEARVPTLLFLGMPVFALLLKLFYAGSHRFYIEHLVFSLHLHTWAFLALMIGDGYLQLAALGPAWLLRLAAVALLGWMGWYTLSAFRAVYGQAWGRTAWKVVVLAGVYFTTLVVLLVGLVTLALAWLAYA